MPPVSGNNRPMPNRSAFAARGGWWIAAQVPILLVALFLAPWTSAAQGAFGHAVQYLGGALLLVSVGTIVAGLVTLGPALTPFPAPRSEATLVTRGIYSLVRHPIYSGLIVGSFGWALAWLSPLGALYALIVAIFFDRKVAREEVWLRARYPSYETYAKRVRRFIPGVY